MTVFLYPAIIREYSHHGLNMQDHHEPKENEYKALIVINNSLWISKTREEMTEDQKPKGHEDE